MATKLTPDQMQSYWGKTSKLMWTILALWFFFSFVVHFFAPSLNGIRILGFPLGFYMAAQGSLIIYVVIIWYYARYMNTLDQEYGVAEGEEE